MKRGAVLLVANYPSDVGYAWWLMEAYWAAIAERLAARGRSSFLAYPSVRELPPRIAEARVEVIELPWPGSSAQSLATFMGFIRARNVTGLYLTDHRLLDWKYAVLRGAGIRRIVVHDHTPGDRPRIGGLKGACKAAAFRLPGLSADRAIGATDFVTRRLRNNGRFPASRCRTVPNGLPLTPLPTANDRRIARETLQLAPDAVAIGIMSRAQRIKNWSFAIEVARSVALAPGTARSNVTWVFCGDGPDLAGFRKEAEAAGISRYCSFLGRREDVPALLAGMDIGMHPSRGEVGYSLSTLEFMRAGLPVIVPDLPSVCGATGHERTGLVYPAGDRAAAAAAICRLVDAPDLRHRLGMAGRAELESRHSLDAALEALVREVADFI